MQRAARAWLFLMFTGCASSPPSKPPVVPASVTPALVEFLAEARKMGMVYETPPGYVEIPVRDNTDQSYDYAVVSADKRTEMRFALRGNDRVPEPLHNRKMSFLFFMTGISNLVRVGNDGRFAEPGTIPAAHYNADDAVLIAVHWFQIDKPGDAFGDGYQLCSAVFMYREGVGAAYSYFLFKDGDALADMNEETMHVMRFAPR